MKRPFKYAKQFKRQLNCTKNIQKKCLSFFRDSPKQKIKATIHLTLAKCK